MFDPLNNDRYSVFLNFVSVYPVNKLFKIRTLQIRVCRYIILSIEIASFKLTIHIQLEMPFSLPCITRMRMTNYSGKIYNKNTDNTIYCDRCHEGNI